MAVGAGLGHMGREYLRLRVLVLQDLVLTVAVGADGSLEGPALLCRNAVDALDVMVVDLQVALATGVGDVCPGDFRPGVFGRKDLVVAVAALAGRCFLVALESKPSVDAPAVGFVVDLLGRTGDVAPEVASGAVYLLGRLTVGNLDHVGVAVDALLVLVYRVGQNLLVHVEQDHLSAGKDLLEGGLAVADGAFLDRGVRLARPCRQEEDSQQDRAGPDKNLSSHCDVVSFPFISRYCK